MNMHFHVDGDTILEITKEEIKASQDVDQLTQWHDLITEKQVEMSIFYKTQAEGNIADPPLARKISFYRLAMRLISDRLETLGHPLKSTGSPKELRQREEITRLHGVVAELQENLRQYTTVAA